MQPPPPETFSDVVYGFFSVLLDFFSRAVPEATFSFGPDAVGSAQPLDVPVYVTDVLPLLLSNEQLEVLAGLWEAYVPVAIFISLVFLAGSIYSILRVHRIREVERQEFKAAAESVRVSDEPRTKLRWERVMDHLDSEDEHQWRLAILEADIMLNELLDILGYKGETMADKMKQANRSQFHTIDSAWEAHKARNRVAHEGSEFPLSRDEANRIISLYAQVFREFKLIE